MDMEGLGERIKELREEAGISQPTLAKGICVSNCIISKWENNLMEPKATYIVRLCKYFNISSDELLGLDNTTGAKYNRSFNNITAGRDVNIRNR